MRRTMVRLHPAPAPLASSYSSDTGNTLSSQDTNTSTHSIVKTTDYVNSVVGPREKKVKVQAAHQEVDTQFTGYGLHA